MKVNVGLVLGLILPAILLFGCAAPTPGETLIEVSCDEFMAENHITWDIEITLLGSLVVSLCANPTTGFQWTENAQIGDTSVMSQYEHNFAAPQSEEITVGASGKDVWTFKSLKKGTTTIIMEYSRPWDSREKGEWTYTLKVTGK